MTLVTDFLQKAFHLHIYTLDNFHIRQYLCRVKPILFEFATPGFLQGILPETMTVYSYGLMIFIGAMLAYWWVGSRAKKDYGLSFSDSAELALLLFLAAFVGGKLFFYFEDPGYYFGKPSRMLEGMSNGFVFYGSLLFCIPAMWWFFRKYKLPILPMIDIMAVAACLAHGFGRIGCFLAGCCHGVPWDGPFAVVFTDKACVAEPMNTPLHPTQLYAVALIFSILGLLLYLGKNKKFHGQIFLTYLMLYAVGRIIIENFRGDFERGYIIENWLTHSQLIALLLIGVAAYFYNRFRKTQRI